MGFDYTEAIYEAIRIAGDAQACNIQPQALAAGANIGEWVDMSGVRRVCFAVLIGAANDAAATLDINVQQAVDAVGTGAKALAGVRGAKIAVQVVAGAGFATRNELTLIEVRAEEMDVNNAFAFLAPVVTVSAGDTWQVGVVPLRTVLTYSPAVTFNVTEIVD